MQDKKGHPLRQERLRKGWTQQELADFAQVSLTSIERAERGNPLRVDICSRICRCLGKEKPEELGLQCNGGYEESRVSVETFDEVTQALSGIGSQMIDVVKPVFLKQRID